MPLVKVTRSRQVTIPKELFDELELQQGDYLEITKEGTQLILRPKSIVDRERDRERAWAKERLFELLDRIWERNQDADPQEVEREVAQAIQEVRKARRKAK